MAQQNVSRSNQATKTIDELKAIDRSVANLEMLRTDLDSLSTQIQLQIDNMTEICKSNQITYLVVKNLVDPMMQEISDPPSNFSNQYVSSKKIADNINLSLNDMNNSCTQYVNTLQNLLEEVDAIEEQRKNFTENVVYSRKYLITEQNIEQMIPLPLDTSNPLLQAANDPTEDKEKALQTEIGNIGSLKLTDTINNFGMVNFTAS